jgi:hypothetical protein
MGFVDFSVHYEYVMFYSVGPNLLDLLIILPNYYGTRGLYHKTYYAGAYQREAPFRCSTLVNNP